MDSNLHMFMEKPSRQLAAEQNNGPLCHNDKKKLPTAFRRNGVVISTITASEWCVDDGETHENAHQYVSSPLQVVVTKCEDPLRQFHHSKDGVLVTSTCNASEWCMTHVESHGTHVNPHLDQSWTNQHPNSHWSALCERKRRNSTVNVFRCNNPILILQGGAEIIPQRIAPEWCVVALTTTCSTSPLINGHNLHMFIEKATRLPQND